MIFYRKVRKASPALEIRRVSSLLDQKGAICQRVDKSFEKGIISTIIIIISTVIIIIVIIYNFVIIIAMTVIFAVTAKIINACCLVKSLVWFVEKRYEPPIIQWSLISCYGKHRPSWFPFSNLVLIVVTIIITITTTACVWLLSQRFF